MDDRETRRALLAMASAGALLGACRKQSPSSQRKRAVGISPASASSTKATPAGDPDLSKEKEVGATEDLMREHGVIRRVLVAYRESAARLKTKPSSVSPTALQEAAKLIRAFGEDYHEKQLEEAHVFPAVKRASVPASADIDVLIAQHQRGREITDYILSVTRRVIGAATADPLARTLEAFARMYEVHTAREDTIVFPAWKEALSPAQLDEMGDLFEDIEHKTFGSDGFEDAVDRVAAIEKTLGIDLAAMTAPPPPKS